MIVENYLKFGRPVSSDCIAQKSKIRVSPATVRNIMTKLEEQDYLFKPHLSAGRIPTDKGLRFYVNRLFDKVALSNNVVNIPFEDFSLKKSDLNSLFLDVSKLLSEYSDNIGFVIYPRISRINFHHIRMIKLSEERIMIILITPFNLALTEIVETKTCFTQSELERASRYIDENFQGKNLLFIRDYLLKEFPKYTLKFEKILQKLTLFFRSQLFQDESENQILLQGTSKFLEKSDFFDMKELKSLLQKFEEKANLAKLLSDFISLDRVKVLIGSELDIPDVFDCALVLSHYGYERQVLGTLGVIGPKRIPYKRIIPLVDCVAKRLSQTISLSQ